MRNPCLPSSTARTGLALVAALCTTAASAAADVIELDASRDNTLYQEPAGGLSNGAGQHFFAGNNSQQMARRGLLGFDIAGSLPGNAIIDSVTLRLHMSRTQPGDQTIFLHRVFSDWGEGTSDADGSEGGGAPATDGDATWLHTFYDDQLWNNPGGDFVIEESASLTVGDVGFYEWTSADMAADVQQWLDAPDQNFGWLLRGNESASQTSKRFDSRENPNADLRPVLIVNYTVPAPAAGLLFVAALGCRRRKRS